MKKVNIDDALNQAYKNLYNSDIKDIDKNLDIFIKAKKNASKAIDNEPEL